MQKSQINKVTTGTVSVTSGVLSNFPKISSSSPIVMDFTKQLALNRSVSPSKMLPFDDFYKMFDEYSSTHKQESAQLANTLHEAPSPTKVANKIDELK